MVLDLACTLIIPLRCITTTHPLPGRKGAALPLFLEGEPEALVNTTLETLTMQ